MDFDALVIYRQRSYQMKRRVRVLGLLPHVDHDPLGGRRHQLDPLLGRLLHRQLEGKNNLPMLSFAQHI